MAIILKANKVNLFVSSVLSVFWYHSPNFLDTPYMPTDIAVMLATLPTAVSNVFNYNEAVAQVQ
jgi:hypothetical protein